MPVQVRIPTPLRAFTQNKDEVSVRGSTVREVVAELDRNYPGIGARLLDEKGDVRRYVNLFLNDEDVRFLKELDTPVKDGDRLSLVPAIAGGRNVPVSIRRAGACPPPRWSPCIWPGVRHE